MKQHQEYRYLDLLDKILIDGEKREDRTGTGTLSLFGPQIEFDISSEFPLLTTKKVLFDKMLYELLWFIRGDTNIRYLLENNVNIWNEWPHKVYTEKTGENISVQEFKKRVLEDDEFAEKWGDAGPIYGSQWRRFGEYHREGCMAGIDWDPPIHINGVDQLSQVINSLKNNPFSRRHIVTAWNPKDLHLMSLPPCHCFFHFYVREDKYLDCKMYQRSADMFLGVPFNIASYSLLTYMIAKVVDLEPGRYIHTFGDAHIYLNHIDQVKEQLSRTPKKLPTIILKDRDNINDFVFEDVELVNYDSHPFIKAEISV